MQNAIMCARRRIFCVGKNTAAAAGEKKGEENARICLLLRQ
jgi:hypothetical protein